MIFSVSIEVYDAISTGGTITNKNEYDIKTFFSKYILPSVCGGRCG